MKMLVCTDGSEQAERALRLAVDWAAACEAQVTLLGINESPGKPELLLNALARGQQMLETQKIAAELVTKSGHPIEEIVHRTEQLPYDLVVIGAVRKGQRGPFSLSAKAYKIIKLIKPPVLVVMGNAAAPKRILICSGGKRYIESAFELVGKIAQKMAASITLLHVLPQAPAIYSEIRRREANADLVLNSNSELGRTLRQEQQALAALGTSTSVRLRYGFVLDEISREIREGSYDLVVVGSSLSAGPLRTYVMGDVTREIINRADCPVLVARHVAKPPNFKTTLRELLQGFTLKGPVAGVTKPR